jgi:CDGSH-type Zn-finger protein
MPPNHDPKPTPKKIIVSPDGPYCIQGDIPLVRKIQVVSEYGEPLTWKKQGNVETSGTYELCRCGQSGNKPFCDGTHYEIEFDGTETADPRTMAERQRIFTNGTRIVVKRDFTLCSESGFCGNCVASIEEMIPFTDDTQMRAQVMAMIERCPSGALAYSVEAGEADIEPDLPEQIALTIEITSSGPIAGPLWVTGNIPIERADGQPLETRNRVTLCCCGLSKIKPLCDGTHRAAQVKKMVIQQPGDCESLPKDHIPPVDFFKR